MASPVPEGTRHEMVRLYVDEGLSLARVGERTYWSANAVRRTLIDEGVTMRPPGANCGPRIHHVLSERDIDETVELYQQGLSLDAVARELGLARSTVTYRLRKAGVPLRPKGTTIRYYHLRQIAARGKDALHPGTRALIEALAEAPHPLLTREVAQCAGLAPKDARRLLKRLEEKGLVASRRRPPIESHRAPRLYEWRRTSLAMMDVLRAALDKRNPNGRGDVWLPIGPFRDWLNGLVAKERRKAMHLAVTGTRGYNGDGSGGLQVESAIAARLDLCERRLWALRFEQKSVTLTLADRCLTLAGDDAFLWDLWPELGEDGDVTDRFATSHWGVAA